MITPCKSADCGVIAAAFCMITAAGAPASAGSAASWSQPGPGRQSSRAPLSCLHEEHRPLSSPEQRGGLNVHDGLLTWQ